jgi:hypothetical protein
MAQFVPYIMVVLPVACFCSVALQGLSATPVDGWGWRLGGDCTNMLAVRFMDSSEPAGHMLVVLPAVRLCPLRGA